MSETNAPPVERIDFENGWTLAEVSRQTGRPTVTVRRWVRNGTLPAWRLGDHGPWYVDPADVAHLIQTNRRLR